MSNILVNNKIENGLAILVSGGRSSAKMAYHIQNSPKYDKYEKLYIFCNTGQERPETIQFLKDMVYHWGIPLNIIEGVYSLVKGIGIKSKLVTFDNMDMDGRVYSEAIAYANKIKTVGVPCSTVPYCSEYTKTRVSHDFARELFGTPKYIKALGYRAEDMPKRITFAELNEDTRRIAPLLTDFSQPVNLSELTRWFKEQPFQLQISSDLGNCELCWKKSQRNLIKVIQHGTRFIDWHKKHEEEYGNMFFRDNLSITDLVRLAESGTQLAMFEDESGDQCVCNF